MNRVVQCLVAFLLLGASAAGAQTDPRLVAAVRSAQEGQGDSARSAVDRLLASTPTTDSLYPEILYTQAMVANTAADMRRHLQRVVVEYPTSPWVDDGLLRLVQMDYATRSFDNAARNLERLRLDYPLTPLFGQAAYWAGRTYFDLKDTTNACRWLAEGMARAEADVELQRQLGFMHQRCAASVAAQRWWRTPPRSPRPHHPTRQRPRRGPRRRSRRQWTPHPPRAPHPRRARHRRASGSKSPPSRPRVPRTMRPPRRKGSATPP